jgi:hypothetical protein
MRALTTLAFGALALVTANFATVAPAAANNVGVYAGSNGFAIQVDNYGRYGHRRCWDRWYRYHHPYQCGYSRYYPGYSGYNSGYYGHRSYRYDYRYHRRHDGWRDRDRHHDRRDRDRRW